MKSVEYKQMKTALLNIKDDPHVISALILDTIYRWKLNNLSFYGIEKLLVEEEAHLSINKLEGLMHAIIQVQLGEKIPEFILERILNILESRLFDNQPEDAKWIRLAFFLLTNSYSQYRLDSLINFIYGPKPVPSSYIGLYIKTLEVYINISRRVDPNIQNYLDNKSKNLKENLKNFSDQPTYVRKYKRKIIDILKYRPRFENYLYKLSDDVSFFIKRVIVLPIVLGFSYSLLLSIQLSLYLGGHFFLLFLISMVLSIQIVFILTEKRSKFNKDISNNYYFKIMLKWKKLINSFLFATTASLVGAVLFKMFCQ